MFGTGELSIQETMDSNNKSKQKKGVKSIIQYKIIQLIDSVTDKQEEEEDYLQ